MPVLIEGLGDADAAVRFRAVMGLLNMGAEGRQAVPTLERALADDDPRVHTMARQALRSIRGR